MRLCVLLDLRFHHDFVFIFFPSTKTKSFLLVNWWEYDQWKFWDGITKERFFSSATKRQGAGNTSDIPIRKLMLKRVRVEAAFFFSCSFCCFFQQIPEKKLAVI